MKRHLCTVLFLIGLLPAGANAQGDCWTVVSNNSVTGSGLAASMRLSLGDCSDAGASHAAANCDSNTGLALPLVVSAVAPPGIDRMVACEAYGTIAPEVEHYLASVRISRAKFTGAGACAGCEQGACIGLSHVVLNQPTGSATSC